jgi:hypothetical protein
VAVKNKRGKYGRGYECLLMGSGHVLVEEMVQYAHDRFLWLDKDYDELNDLLIRAASLILKSERMGMWR